MSIYSKALVVSEMFYSIQGEGVSVGVPSVFLRLSGCNMRCRGFSYKDPKTGEHLGCDSLNVWMRGDKWLFDALLVEWQQLGFIEALSKGAHLVITGGEPLIQQQGLVLFLQKLDEMVECVFIEMETNGSILPDLYLLGRVNQFNVSPKLRFSKEPQEKAYREDVLLQLKQSQKAYFKFVVRNKADVDEVIGNYVQPFKLDPKQVILMPEGGALAVQKQHELDIVELCKQTGFRFGPRLHIYLWNEATGV